MSGAELSLLRVCGLPALGWQRVAGPAGSPGVPVSPWAEPVSCGGPGGVLLACRQFAVVLPFRNTRHLGSSEERHTAAHLSLGPSSALARVFPAPGPLPPPPRPGRATSDHIGARA